jgi:hypothetical protein
MSELQSLGLLESVTVFGRNVVFREAYNTVFLEGWYLSSDMHLIVCHLDFVNRLSTRF